MQVNNTSITPSITTPVLKPTTTYVPTFVERIAAKASEFPDKFFKHIELNQGTLTRKTNFAIAFFVILGARYLSARDRHERREVLTRDSIGVAMVFYGVPLLKKFIGNLVPKMTGFVIKDNDEFAKEHQIKSLYSIDPKHKSNNPLYSLCENLNKMGGDLKQIFKKADNDVRKLLLEHILKKTSFDDIANNDEFLKAIKDAGKSEFVDAVEHNLSSSENVLLRRAKILKAAPELACILLVAGILGVLLPWYNIKHTRSILKKEQANNPVDTVTAQNKIQNVNYTSSQYIAKQKELFANIISK